MTDHTASDEETVQMDWSKVDWDGISSKFATQQVTALELDHDVAEFFHPLRDQDHVRINAVLRHYVSEQKNKTG